jgi:hypothetical protein
MKALADLLHALDFGAMRAGRREVWTASHGHAGRYHVVTPDNTAACRPGRKQSDGAWSWRNRGVIVICEQTEIPLLDVPAHMACTRSGCRQIFLAAIQ